MNAIRSIPIAEVETVVFFSRDRLDLCIENDGNNLYMKENISYKTTVC